jgi:hypothetical protein
MPRSVTARPRKRWTGGIESFARDHGLGTHVLLRTGMRFFPWLGCPLPESGWAGPVREAPGGDLVLVAADGGALVVVFEEEYSYQGFATYGPAVSETSV